MNQNTATRALQGVRDSDLALYMGSDAPPRSDLVSVLQHWATIRGDAPAFFFSDGENPLEDQCLSFAELDAAARNVAGHLQRHNAKGQRVLLLYPPVLDFVIGFFGCLYAGATAVPAFPPRRNRKGQRIHGIARDCQAQLALTNQFVRQQIEADANWTEWESVVIMATDSLAQDYSSNWKNPQISPDDLAVLQYTSGSTGQPKGVMLSHGNLVRNTEMIMVAFEAGSNCIGCSWLPTYHDMGLVGGVLTPLFIGRPAVLMSPMAFLQKPIRWLQTITRYKATTCGGPNFSYQLCVDKISDDELEGVDLSSWETAFNGAEPVRASTLKQFYERFRHLGFRDTAFLPCYGMAETTLIVSGGPKTDLPFIRSFDAQQLDGRRVVPCEPDAAHARELVGSGMILPGEKVLVVDPDSCMPMADDQVGELWVSSPSVGQGYWEREEATHEVFEAMTADGQGPFLRTGDLGFIFEEQLFVAGRLKDMIIVRGVNRYPQDIEQTVEQSHEIMQSGLVAAFGDDCHQRERLIICAEVQKRVEGCDWDEVIKIIRRERSPAARTAARCGDFGAFRHASADIQR